MYVYTMSWHNHRHSIWYVYTIKTMVCRGSICTPVWYRHYSTISCTNTQIRCYNGRIVRTQYNFWSLLIMILYMTKTHYPSIQEGRLIILNNPTYHCLSIYVRHKHLIAYKALGDPQESLFPRPGGELLSWFYLKQIVQSLFSLNGSSHRKEAYPNTK